MTERSTRMIFKNIRDLIRNHTLLFTIFTLLLAFSFCGVLYSVNLLTNVKRNNSKTPKEDRAYVFSVNDIALDNKLKRIALDDEAFEHIYCVIDNHGERIIADFLAQDEEDGKVSFGKFFEQEDIEKGAKKVILPNYPNFSDEELAQHTVLKIGEIYTIGTTAYQAIGIGVHSQFVYQIPYNSIQDKSVISQVAIVTKSIGDKEQIRTLSSQLQSVFGGEIIQEPTAKELSFFSKHGLTDVFLVIGVTAVSVFNLAYIYLHILEMRKKEIAINRISGQTALSVVATSYGEVFILSTVVYFICVLFFDLVILPLLGGLGYWFADSLGFYQYLFVYIVLVAIYSIVFLPALICHAIKSPIEALTYE